VLGPEKLPKVAAQLGRYAAQARRMARTLTAQIRDEIEAEERRVNAGQSAPTAATVPEQPSYSRPGADDLMPRTAGELEEESAPAPADASAEPGDRPSPSTSVPGP